MVCDALSGKYQLADFPFKKAYIDLTKKEAKITFDWFLAEKDNRMRILHDAVESEAHDVAKQMDFSPESLVPVAEWLIHHVHTMDKTPEAIEREKANIRHPFFKMIADRIVTKWTWTPETFSLYFDVGIYLGEVFRKRFKDMEWTYDTVRTVFMNMPCLTGYRIPVVPENFVGVVGSSVQRNEINPKALKNVFDVWSQLILFYHYYERINAKLRPILSEKTDSNYILKEVFQPISPQNIHTEEFTGFLIEKTATVRSKKGVKKVVQLNYVSENPPHWDVKVLDPEFMSIADNIEVALLTSDILPDMHYVRQDVRYM